MVRSTPRRAFPWLRVILLLLVAGGIAYFVIPRFFYISADAQVQGDLVPIAPLFRARIERLQAHCNDRVHAGQSVAVVSNFLVAADYEQQEEQSRQQLAAARIASDEGVSEARIEEQQARDEALADELAARKARELMTATAADFRAGAVGRAEWDAVREDAAIAASRAEGATQAWHQAAERTQRVVADNATKSQSYALAVNRLGALRDRVQAEPLHAPISGRLVDCAARPLAIVEAGTPIFNIFGTDRAYVLAYFSPGDAARMRVGQLASVDVSGMPAGLQGKIVAIYPDLTKLPDALTKYFWQHEQWSEYRPVRVAFEGLRSDLREQLAYGARGTVRIRLQ